LFLLLLGPSSHLVERRLEIAVLEKELTHRRRIFSGFDEVLADVEKMIIMVHMHSTMRSL
jgi:hypothetical protein